MESLSFGTVWIEMSTLSGTGIRYLSLSFGTVWIEIPRYRCAIGR